MTTVILHTLDYTVQLDSLELAVLYFGQGCIEMSLRNIHIQEEAGRWIVSRDGDDTPTEIYLERRTAVRSAIEIAKTDMVDVLFRFEDGKKICLVSHTQAAALP